MKPPTIPELAVAWLLPPSSRAQVLGDLEERFRPSPPGGAARRYWLDAASVIPRVMWAHVFRDRPEINAIGSDLRRRAEAFQDTLWARQFRLLVVTPLMFAMMTGPALAKGKSQWLLAVLLVAGAVFVGTFWKDASGRQVPGSLSDDELRIFHRSALMRQRDLMRAFTWQGFSLYGFLVFFVMLVSLALNLPTFAWRLSILPLGALAIFGFSRQRTAVLEHLQKLQHEIDSLEPAA